MEFYVYLTQFNVTRIVIVIIKVYFLNAERERDREKERECIKSWEWKMVKINTMLTILVKNSFFILITIERMQSISISRRK